MGRASVILGAPDSNSGIMDKFIVRTPLFSKESGRSSPFGADRVGQALPQLEASTPTAQTQNAQEANKEMTLRELWFQLPSDERAQFGSCFSRMLLKCLNDVETKKETRT